MITLLNLLFLSVLCFTMIDSSDSYSSPVKVQIEYLKTSRPGHTDSHGIAEGDLKMERRENHYCDGPKQC
jgi:hypothetical protein